VRGGAGGDDLEVARPAAFGAGNRRRVDDDDGVELEARGVRRREQVADRVGDMERGLSPDGLGPSD